MPNIGSNTLLTHAVVLTILTVCLFPYGGKAAGIGVSGPQRLCEGSSLQAVKADSGYTSYLWSTGERGQTIYVNTGGTYVVYATNGAGSLDSGRITIRDVPKPHPFIGNGRQYLCEGDVAALQAPDQFVWYRWNTGDTTRSISISTNGVFRVTVMDTNGCIGSSDSLLVEFLPVPTSRVNGPNAACRGSEVTYVADDVPGATYSWNVVGGTIISGQNTRIVRVRWNTSGQVELTTSLVRPDAQVCSSVAQYYVRVGARLRPELLFERRNICEGDSTELRVGNGYRSYQWNTGDTTSTIFVSASGLYWVDLVDSSGCTGTSDSLEVFVHPLPIVEITGPRIVCQGELFTLSATPGIAIYQWNTGERTASIQVTSSGVYQVIATTLDNCSDTAQFEVLAGASPTATIDSLVQLGPTIVNTTSQTTIVLQNTGTTPFSIMDISFVPPMNELRMLTPTLPRLLDPGRSVSIVLAWSPTVIGTTSVRMLCTLLSDCSATLSTTLTASAIDAPPPATLLFSLPDTTVAAGTTVYLPISVTVEGAMDDSEAVDVEGMIRFKRTLLASRGVSSGLYISESVDDTVRRVQFRVLDVHPSRSLRVTDLIVETMLDIPPFTALNFESITISPAGSHPVRTNDGSCTITTCFLEGRMVRFLQPLRIERLRIDDADFIELDVLTQERGSHSIVLHAMDGRSVASSTFEHTSDIAETHTVHMPRRTLAHGLYFIQLTSPFEVRTIPVLLHE
ncbi:hypothetical protein BH10BAC6_BH10BAC6_14650 [soil metagenome]